MPLLLSNVQLIKESIYKEQVPRHGCTCRKHDAFYWLREKDLEGWFLHLPDDKDHPKTWETIDFEQYDFGILTQVKSMNGASPYTVMGHRR